MVNFPANALEIMIRCINRKTERINFLAKKIVLAPIQIPHTPQQCLGLMLDHSFVSV
jgi:hypothetical protein